MAEAELNSLKLPPTTVDTAGMIGMVTMTRSLIAAADKRPGDVAAPMQAAKELATQFGEPDDNRDRLGFGFGPTNVGLWEMALALEAGEPDRAVSVAQTIQPAAPVQDPPVSVLDGLRPRIGYLALVEPPA